MKEVVRFFWERWKRACQMDAASNSSKYTHEADEWTDAYKQTLSKNNRDKFEKEWNKLNQDLEAYFAAPPKKQKNMNPMGLPN